MNVSNRKNPSRQKKFKFILFFIMGTCVLAALFLVVMSPFKKTPSLTKTSNNTSDGTNDRTKASSISKSPDVDNSKNTSQIPLSTSSSINTISLTQDPQNISYFATITNPGDTGTCSATLTNSSARPVLRVTTTTSDTCGPVSIPSAEFTAQGLWTLTLRYYTSNTQAISTKTIEIGA